MCAASADPRNEGSKTGSMSLIDCHEDEGNVFSLQHCQNWGEFRTSPCPWKGKPFAWIAPPHISAEIKSSGLIFPLENACSLLLRLHNQHLPEYMVNGTKRNTKIYMKTLKWLKQLISRVRRGRRQMLLQPHDAWFHISAVTAAAVQNIGFEVVQHPPFCLVLALLTSSCSRPSRIISMEYTSFAMKMFKLLRKNATE
jgi:hypothetical protein